MSNAVQPAEKGTTVELWKAVSGALISVMVTGIAAWMTFGSDRVTRSDLERYVEGSGPYIRDRQLLMDGLTTVRAKNEANATQMQAILVEQSRSNTKIDALITEISNLREELRKARNNAKQQEQQE